MAKGVEDTAFYRYTRFISLNEVGGDPAEFGRRGRRSSTPRRLARSASRPHAMTTLSTHDTKRGEDVRARLAVLAELPDDWAAALDAAARSSRRCPTRSATCSGRPSSGPGRSPRAAARLRREGDARGR